MQYAFDLRNFQITGGTPVYSDAHVMEIVSSEEGAALSAEGSEGRVASAQWGAYSYLVFDIEMLGDFSLGMKLDFDELAGNGEKHRLNITAGVMPRLKTRVCIPLSLLDGKTLFVERTPAMLKMVVKGNKIDIQRLIHFSLTSYAAHEEYRFRLSNLHLCEEPPAEYPIPDVKLIDKFGQYMPKNWPGKIRNDDELKKRLADQLRDIRSRGGFSNPDYDRWGGWKKKKLTDGTGYFKTFHDGRRWWLTDPDGYAFFSTGADCCAVSGDNRVDMVEKLLTGLPARDGDYACFFREFANLDYRKNRGVSFNYEGANLRRALGENWHDDWRDLVKRLFRRSGMNTLGNWSEENLIDNSGTPYVWTPGAFPSTDKMIFRDFPDVFSPAYRESAAKCAQNLRRRASDPFMIGYFLRNEPQWAFVDRLVIANEVLRNPEDTFSRHKLIRFLKGRYGTVESLNSAWGGSFGSFSDLEKPIGDLVGSLPRSNDDMRAFSALMCREYVRVPSEEYRKIDGNHLNLGMRWAWVSGPDMIAGWDNFDVFSMNCYDEDPRKDIARVTGLGVDRPIIIGEFHFGALDRGLPSTGLRGTPDQDEKGKAWRFYLEQAADTAFCVGAHWFQLYDQFALGRFDGENYQIGLMDICSQPHEQMLHYVSQTSDVIYEVADGKTRPFEGPVKRIPMIGF